MSVVKYLKEEDVIGDSIYIVSTLDGPASVGARDLFSEASAPTAVLSGSSTAFYYNPTGDGATPSRVTVVEPGLYEVQVQVQSTVSAYVAGNNPYLEVDVIGPVNENILSDSAPFNGTTPYISKSFIVKVLTAESNLNFEFANYESTGAVTAAVDATSSLRITKLASI
jgi:hypothetical protein